LVSDLQKFCGGDISNLFSTPVVMDNDAVAGTKATSVYIAKVNPDIRKIVYAIVGGGVGGTELEENMINPAEPGHVKVIDTLNPFNQTVLCKVRRHVCLESVSGGSAINQLWETQYPFAKLSGPEIAERMRHGHTYAKALYENSSLAIAHMIIGMGNLFNAFDKPEETAIALHGGVFNFQEYGERVKSIVRTNTKNGTPYILRTKDFSPNACLEGAAIAAVYTHIK